MIDGFLVTRKKYRREKERETADIKVFI